MPITRSGRGGRRASTPFIQQQDVTDSEEGEIQGSSDGEVSSGCDEVPPPPPAAGQRKKGKKKTSTRKKGKGKQKKSGSRLKDTVAADIQVKGTSQYLVDDEVIALAIQKFEQAEAAKRRERVRVSPPSYREREREPRDYSPLPERRRRSPPRRCRSPAYDYFHRDARGESSGRRRRSRSLSRGRRRSRSPLYRRRSRSTSRDRYRDRSYERGFRDRSYERGSRRSRVSLPGETLYNHLTRKQIKAIEDDIFIPFEHLLKSKMLRDIYDCNQDVDVAAVRDGNDYKLKLKRGKLDKISDFEQWQIAFHVFAACRLDYVESEGKGLLLYEATVKQLQREGGAWQEYDEEFRLSREKCYRPWGVPWDSMYYRCSNMGIRKCNVESEKVIPSSNVQNVHKSGNTSGNVNSNANISQSKYVARNGYRCKRMAGYCWEWQVGGCNDPKSCKQSRMKHICELCRSSNHGGYVCPGTGNRPSSGNSGGAPVATAVANSNRGSGGSAGASATGGR